jgi:hypothetical protein
MHLLLRKNLFLRNNLSPIALGGVMVFAAIFALSSGARGAPASPIQIGRNVRISTAYSDFDNEELQISADPNDANHLIGAAIVMTQEPLMSNMVAAFESRDGGRTWRETMHTTDPGNLCDPGTAFGPGGVAYLVVAGYSPDPKVRPYSLLYRSSDGGATWAKPVRIDRLDTEFVAVDRTGAKHDGRVYIDGVGGLQSIEGPDISALVVMHSDNRGATRPYTVEIGAADPHIAQSSGPPVVLSDGTLIVPFDYWPSVHAMDDASAKHPATNKYRVAISTDGGETFTIKTVGDWLYYDTPRNGPTPALAADTTRGAFRDRVYAAWSSFVDGRWQIVFSHSSDKGKTWSTPFAVNDDVTNFRGRGPDDFKPALAVNRAGVVMITWYDRRDNPDDVGYWPRAAVSYDGGESFTPSVRLSTAPFNIMKSVDVGGPMREVYGDSHNRVTIWAPREAFQGGDYTAIAADANGVFHPVWEDNRTGHFQMFTARVTVSGEAMRFGSREWNGWEDVSKETWLELRRETYDPTTETVTADADIANDSKAVIRGPLVVRILDIRSILGHVALSNGAKMLDFTPLMPSAGLAPKATTGLMKLRFHITGAPSMSLVPERAYYNEAMMATQVRFQILNKP